MLLGQRYLRAWVREYLAHYHQERSHQGLGGRIILPAAGLTGRDAGLLWLGNWLLGQAYPESFSPIEARRVVIEAITIHSDAGLPRPGATLNPFALRLLTDAAGDWRWEETPIYRHFPDDGRAQEDFGGLEDGVTGIVPFAACTTISKSSLLMRFVRVTRRRGGNAKTLLQSPSDNRPYAIGRYEAITFPPWVP